MGPAQSGPMKIRVQAELVYRFDPPTDAIYKIQVAHWPGQVLLEERLTTVPAVAFHEDEDAEFGARTLRADAVPVAAISVLQFLWESA